jgi:hypothetical protein
MRPPPSPSPALGKAPRRSPRVKHLCNSAQAAPRGRQRFLRERGLQRGASRSAAARRPERRGGSSAGVLRRQVTAIGDIGRVASVLTSRFVLVFILSRSARGSNSAFAVAGGACGCAMATASVSKSRVCRFEPLAPKTLNLF